MKSKAILRTDKNLPCAFCNLCEDNEVLYGPMYTTNEITCHYFCVLLSSSLIQNGKDREGVQGFLYKDIKHQLKQGESYKCYLCGKNRATIFCCFRSCRRSFHLPCGITNNCISLFYNTFQSFCNLHRKNQHIPREILKKCRKLVVKIERIPETSIKANRLNGDVLNRSLHKVNNIDNIKVCDNVCYICYEPVIFDNMNDIFWPPCCKGFTWFHKNCLSRMALSSGRYFIRCPLCNNVPIFVDSLKKFGIYIPERDAAWERENGAFLELMERPNECAAKICKCPSGRKYHKSKSWNMTHCNLCGSEAIHMKCMPLISTEFNCSKCVKEDQDTNALEDIGSSNETDTDEAIETKENECSEAEEIDFNETHKSCTMEIEDNDEEIQIDDEPEVDERTNVDIANNNSSQHSLESKMETEDGMAKFICENTYVSNSDEESAICKNTSYFSPKKSDPPIILTVSQSASSAGVVQDKSLATKKRKNKRKKLWFKYPGSIDIKNYFQRTHDENDTTRLPISKDAVVFNKINTKSRKKCSVEHRLHNISRNSLKKIEKKKKRLKQSLMSKPIEKYDIRKYFLSFDGK